MIDNVGDTAVIQQYLPNRAINRHTLLTLRNPNILEIPAIGVKVNVMKSGESVQLLLRRWKSGPDAVYSEAKRLEAAEIVKELGYLPLAIEQASAYIREVSKDIAKYLPHYRKNKPKYYSRAPKGSWFYEMTVATTWKLSFAEIKANNDGASKLQELFAFLNPDGILLDFIDAGKEGLNTDLRRIVEEEEELDEALSELERFSLIEWQANQAGKHIKIHRLVQQVTKDGLDETQKNSL